MLATDQIIAEIDYIPWAVDILRSEAIAVIPLLDFWMVRLQIVIIQKSRHLAVAETEVFVILLIRDWINLEVIQAGKNAFLWYPEATRQNCEVKAGRRTCWKATWTMAWYPSSCWTWNNKPESNSFLLIDIMIVYVPFFLFSAWYNAINLAFHSYLWRFIEPILADSRCPISFLWPNPDSPPTVSNKSIRRNFPSFHQFSPVAQFNHLHSDRLKLNPDYCANPQCFACYLVCFKLVYGRRVEIDCKWHVIIKLIKTYESSLQGST